jgi:hypothetical protein
MEKNVCSFHFGDKSIKGFIKKNGAIGDCDYCKRRSVKIIELSGLGPFIENGLKLIYDYAVDWLGYDSREGGYQGETFETDELIKDYVEFDEYSDELVDDLCYEVSDQTWCYNDPYGETESERLMFDWTAFKQFVIHKARYTFFFLQRESYRSFAESYKINVAGILDEIAKLLTRYKLIHTIKQNTHLYRCRQHGKEIIAEAGDICSPPDDKAIYSNRMSPAGISMFYTAFNSSIAMAETLDPEDKTRPNYSIAEFVTNEDLLMVDFTELPRIPSIFKESKKEHYFPLVFLKQFIGDLTKPIFKDGHEHIEYVPTQVITEYIRFMFSKQHKKQIEGIIFPSSKNIRDKSCVLFLDHQQSLEKLSLVQLKRHKID